MRDNVENNGVTIKTWSPEMLAAFEASWNEVAAELASEDAYFAEVWNDLQEYREGYRVWGNTIYLPRPR
jgi:TRAP-type mannitol/chloroaromatic compound transport system substrate-binding protein